MASDYKELIGTYENPLELQCLSPMRELFRRVITEHKGMDEEYLFKDGYKATFGNDYYLMNLASNPVLTKSDILIGAYLHLRIFLKANNQNGVLFWTGEKSIQSHHFFGESGEFWVKDIKSNMWSYRKPIINLYEDLTKHKIYITPETVIKSLRKLHGCYFITMTTKHGRTESPDDPNIRSEIRHIWVYPEMVYQPVYKHWKPKGKVDLSGLKI